MAAAGLSLPKFSVAKGTFKVYKQVFENKMKIHEVDEKKWSQYLISFIGFDMVTLLSELCCPKTPQDKTYTELVELVEKHLELQQSEIAETYKFMKREQLADESICEFVAALKKLAQTCNFTTHLERYLRYKFVHGLKSESIVKRLFGEEKLTFAKAVEIAMSMELSEKGTKLITAGSSGQESSDINKISEKHVTIKCYCCGKMGPVKPQCRFKEEECFKCHKKGHMASVCKANSNKTFKPKKVHEITNNEKFSVMQVSEVQFNSESVGDSYDFSSFIQETKSQLNINKVVAIDEKRPSPWYITLKINNVNISFEIDCGSDVTLMPESMFIASFPNLKLFLCNLKLSGYGGNNIVVLGKTNVNIKIKNDEYLATLIIVKDGKKPLLGRDWLSAMKIDCQTSIQRCNLIIHQDSQIKLNSLVEKYSDIFSGFPGETKGTLGILKLKEANIKPIAFKPRRIAYAVENLVKKELDKLCTEGKMYKVTNKETGTWATPIVTIIKGPRNIRICGDYKVTINPFLEVPNHPIPVI